MSNPIEVLPPDNEPSVTTLIVDLGNVLFKWSPETKTSLSSKQFATAISSATWFKFERGLISEEECFAAVGEHLNVPISEVAAAFAAVRQSVLLDHEVHAFIASVRKANTTLKVYAMSNISSPDYEALRMQSTDWSIFDQVFTSAMAHERKPDLAFYKHVIRETGCEPQRTIFIDDQLDNVISARSLGMKAIVFDAFPNVARQLRNLLVTAANQRPGVIDI